MSVVDRARPQSRTSPVTPGSPAAATVVIGGPLLVLASELIAAREPADQSAAADAAFLLDHADRFAASWAVGLLAAALLGAGYVIAAHHIRGRGGVVARAAAVLGAVGAAGLAGHMAVSLAVRDLLVADPGASQAADDAFNGLSSLVTVLPVIVGLNLAVLLLSVAAFRAGWAGWWVVAAGALALVADFGPTAYNTVAHAAFALPVFAVVAARVARD